MSCSGDDAGGIATTAPSPAKQRDYPAGTRRRAVSRRLRAALAVPAAAGLIFAFPGLAQASVGVGVQSTPVRLRAVAQPGHSYALPPVNVANTGTQDELIIMRVQRLSGGPGRAVPASWIQFTGSGMRLPARESARIPVKLVVPAGARPGKYLSDVVVVGSAVIAVGRTHLGAAAATKLEFSVGRDPSAGSWLRFPPWTLWTLGGLLLLAAAMLALRASGLQLRIERRPVSSSFIDRRGEYRGG